MFITTKYLKKNSSCPAEILTWCDFEINAARTGYPHTFNAFISQTLLCMIN